MADQQSTGLNRPWVVKMVIFFLVFAVLGAWGLRDALVSYPQRGLHYASYKLFQYLESASHEHQLDSRVNVPDPVGELSRLRKLDQVRYGPLDGPRKDWLESLEAVGKLTPAETNFSDPDKAYTALKQQWLTANGTVQAPKKLSKLDIPVQWVITAIGLGGAFWFLLLFANVARLKYRWEPETQTLTLPDGNALTPADIQEFDKRKWDKYLVFLHVKGTHTTMGGREVKLDLYRYDPLESWVLEMEKTAFPERAAADTAAAPAPEPQA
jgi:hypothetical protein